jgi:hypothetical protein
MQKSIIGRFLKKTEHVLRELQPHFRPKAAESDERKLSKEFYSILIVHTLFLTFTRLPGVFINTMIIGEGDGFIDVILYNGTFYIACALCMVLSAKFISALGARLTAIIGIAMYAALYLTIFALGERAKEFGALIGLINGLADGFYWISHMQLFGFATSLENRDKGLALIQLFSSVVNLLVPLAGSLVISSVGGLRGYLAVFALALALAFFTCLRAAKLPYVASQNGKTDYPLVLRDLKNSLPLRNALCGQCVKGMREGAFLFILSIILFQLVQSELLIGLNTFLSGRCAIISFAIMSRKVRPDNRMRLVLFSVIILCASDAIGIAWATPVGILVYGAMNACFSGPVENTCYTVYLDAVMSGESTREHLPEFIAVNEIILVAGRIIGLGVILGVWRFLGQSVRWQLFSLLILSLSQFIAVYYSKKAADSLREA